jgi:NodT family efflux transporter outer membrane factor (OMF) lipoprotein
VPPAFKEAGDWVGAKPADEAPRGAWWTIYEDPDLAALLEQVAVSNQTLKGAEARYAQARSAVDAARSAFFPSLSGDVNATRSKTRAGSIAIATDGSGTASTGSKVTNYTAGLDARWEIDLWGQLRRQFESGRASEQASAADVEAARLSLQAELATDYFQLRVTDAQVALLEDTVKAFETNYGITKNRYAAGVAARVDLVQAESQLLSVRSQALDLRGTRATLEHAIAVLVGKPPSTFAIPPAPFRAKVPLVPTGVPSTLLERRPDIAAAERRMAAANAQIGVAKAAYFPALTLSGSTGGASTTFSKILDAPNRTWSLGAALAGTILDFGARGAAVDSARAAYDGAVASYRETVLGGFQDVEDNLATLHWLGEASKVQDEAARAARESVTLTLNQYKAGTVSYLNVVQVQATQLAEDRTTVTLAGRRLAASVGLIRALGGSWGPAP